MVALAPRNRPHTDRRSRRNMTLQRSRSVMIWCPRACYGMRQLHAEVTDEFERVRAALDT